MKLSIISNNVNKVTYPLQLFSNMISVEEAKAMINLGKARQRHEDKAAFERSLLQKFASGHSKFSTCDFMTKDWSEEDIIAYNQQLVALGYHCIWTRSSNVSIRHWDFEVSLDA